MKKILTSILSIVLVLSCSISIKAYDKSIQSLNQDKQIDNADKSVSIIYNENEAKVFYGKWGIDIVTKDNTIHFDTNFAVNSLEVINDINNDGIVDFVTYQKATDLADQVFVISGKDGKVLSSYRLTHKYYTDIMGNYDANSLVMQMLVDGFNLYVVSDYSVYCINLLSKEYVWTYTGDDNIWKIILNDNEIIYIDQQGNAGIINKQTGELLVKKQISKTYEVISPWSSDEEKIIIPATVNLWDVRYSNGKLYFLSEDGCLSICDNELNVINSLSIDDVSEEKFNSYLLENLSFQNGLHYESVGILSNDFLGYQIIDEDDNYLLISCHVDSKYNEGNGYPSFPCQFAVVNKATLEVIVRIDNSAYGNKADALLDEYNNETAVVILNGDTNKAIVNVYNTSGVQVFSKNVALAIGEDKNLNFEKNGNEGYRIETYGVFAANIDKSFEHIDFLYDSIVSKLIYFENNQCVIEELVNGFSKRIVAYTSDLKNVLWTYELSSFENNHGFEFKLADDYNNDGVKDILTIVNKYNSENQAKASNFMFIDGSNGKLLVNKKVSLGKMYDEKGKPYTAYLVASELSLVKDLDKDGKKEININNTIYSSKSFAAKGYVSNWIDFSGNLLEIGDVNGDGFVDYVGVGAKNATIYVSKISGYNVTYVKTKTTTSLNAHFKHNEIMKVFGDINNDGVSELITSGKNSNGYQVYIVYDGKTLKKMYEIQPKGITNWECYSVLDQDYNGDGYNEIWGMNAVYYAPFLISGIDGKTLVYIDDGKENDIYDFENDDTPYFHPTEYVEPEITLYDRYPSYFGDFNGNGYNDFVILKNYYNSSIGRYISSLFVYDGYDVQVIKEIPLTSEYSRDVRKINVVKNSDDRYYMIDTINSISLYDSQLDLMIASYNLDGNNSSYFMMNDKKIGKLSESGVDLLDVESCFEVVDSQLDDSTGEFTIKWKTIVDYSVMTIKENGSTIYVGTNDNCTIRLLAGKHTLNLTMEDSYGKSSTQSIEVEVKENKNNYGWLLVMGSIIIIGGIYLNVHRKMKVLKKIKEELA